MEFKNNVFETVLRITRELYPEAKANIYFSEIPVEEDGVHPYGCTTFPDNGSTPIIEIGLHTPVEAVPEILAHEIAHVISGIEAEHNEEWENIFDELQNKWNEVMHKEYGMPLQ